MLSLQIEIENIFQFKTTMRITLKFKTWSMSKLREVGIATSILEFGTGIPEIAQDLR